MPKTFDEQVAERLARLERAVGMLRSPGPVTAVFYYNSAIDANVTGDSTSYTPLCDTKVVDVGSDYNAATGTFTSPYTGFYFVVADVLVEDLGSSHTLGRLDFVRTGMNFYGGYVNPYAASHAGYYTFHGVLMVPMTAGQILYPSVMVGGGTKTVDVHGGAAMYSFLQVFRLR